MAARRPALSLVALVPLSGCALTGPITDPSMRRAPIEACANFEAPPAAADNQCFTLLQRGPTGGLVNRTSTQLQAGDEVFAVKSAAAGCQGAFSHLVVIGDTSGSGEMRIDVVDAVGRGNVGRTVDWEESRTGRRWPVADIDTPLHIPGAVRLNLIEGDVRLTGLCYASYGDINPF